MNRYPLGPARRSFQIPILFLDTSYTYPKPKLEVGRLQNTPILTDPFYLLAAALQEFVRERPNVISKKEFTKEKAVLMHANNFVWFWGFLTDVSEYELGCFLLKQTNKPLISFEKAKNPNCRLFSWG